MKILEGDSPLALVDRLLITSALQQLTCAVFSLKRYTVSDQEHLKYLRLWNTGRLCSGGAETGFAYDSYKQVNLLRQFGKGLEVLL